ncbi:MAG TPA: hypothetical protein VGD81_10620 [Opitutaceae bacterium]
MLASPLPRLIRRLRCDLRLAVRLAPLIATFAVPGAAQVASESPAPPAPSAVTRLRDEILQMREFFETVLPGTLQEHNLTLDVSPKFGDLRKREYMRFPAEVRYGVAPRWELFGGFMPFVPNPANSGEDHRWGVGQVRLGFRHDVNWRLGFYDKMTVGVETRTPLGHPPVSLIDHYTHVRPFLSASRPLPWPHTTFLTTASYDRAMTTPSRDDPPAAVVRQHVTEITPGILYKPGEFGGFAEYLFRHLDEEDGYRLGHGGKIGFIWDPPRMRTKAWGLPGKWQFEIAYKISHEEGRGVDHGISARVRWKTSLREVRETPVGQMLTRTFGPGAGGGFARAPATAP